MHYSKQVSVCWPLLSFRDATHDTFIDLSISRLFDESGNVLIYMVSKQKVISLYIVILNSFFFHIKVKVIWNRHNLHVFGIRARAKLTGNLQSPNKSLANKMRTQSYFTARSGFWSEVTLLISRQLQCQVEHVATASASSFSVWMSEHESDFSFHSTQLFLCSCSLLIYGCHMSADINFMSNQLLFKDVGYKQAYGTLLLPSSVQRYG